MYKNLRTTDVMTSFDTNHHTGNIQMLKVGDLLTDIENKATYRIISKSVSPTSPLLLVDLSHLTYLSSLGLNFLLQLHHLKVSQGGRMCLITDAPVIRKILHLSKLDTYLCIFSNAADARKAYA